MRQLPHRCLEAGRALSNSNAAFSANASSLMMKVAECRRERAQAFELVHDVYCRSGLMEPSSSRLRLIRQHLLDTTDILIGQQTRDVVFTVTLVRDGLYGLPMDSLFGDEVDQMRAQGLNLAEVSCLATSCSSEDKKERFETLVRMISLLLQTARRRGVDRLLLAVHPKHAKVYERLFGCKRCSGVREYEAVRGNPAVLCMHDFAALDSERYPLYDRMYNPLYAPWQMDGARMLDEEREYLEQLLPSDDYNLVPMAA